MNVYTESIILRKKIRRNHKGFDVRSLWTLEVVCAVHGSHSRAEILNAKFRKIVAYLSDVLLDGEGTGGENGAAGGQALYSRVSTPGEGKSGFRRFSYPRYVFGVERGSRSRRTASKIATPGESLQLV